MIIDEGGKYKSVRTREETKRLLLEEIKTLTPEERAAFRVVLQELAKGEEEGKKGPSLVDYIGNAEFKQKPVDLETFVKDPYFLGDTCENIFPVLLQDLKNIFSGGYNEVILTGAIGTGKTFSASIGVCRVLYEISCLKSPHKSYGLAKDSNISIVALSVNETLAIKVAFEYIATKLKNSPYFQEHFPFKQMKKELRFDNNIWVAARASTDTSVLGLNPISGILDETNFLQKPTRSVRNMPGGPMYDQAETLYNAIKRRMKSRFERRGKLPGVLFLSSSKQTVDDFTARRIRESKNDPNVYIMDYALWEIRPHDYNMNDCFHVLCGNENALSRILDEDEVETVRGTLPEGAAIIKVPSDFRTDFERDLEGSIRDIGGRSTAAISPFISRREKISDAEHAGGIRRHPFSTEVYDMSRGGQFMWNQMVRPVEERDVGGYTRKVLKPIVSPNQLRHAHIDPSLRGDCTGFCLAHVCGWKDVIRRNETGHEYMERAPVYYVDVILRIVPPPGSEIMLGDVRRLIYDLSAHGYLVTRVTMDAFQSADAIQMLSQKGYTAELLSVDTSMDPYENLKLALYENRIILYPYEPLRAELRSLEKNHSKNKVDHPPRSSKDLADALAACLWTLSQAHVNMPLPILPTSALNSAAWADPAYAATVGPGPSAYGSTTSGSHMGALPPFLTGSSVMDWDFGSGWDPGSL